MKKLFMSAILEALADIVKSMILQKKRDIDNTIILRNEKMEGMTSYENIE